MKSKISGVDWLNNSFSIIGVGIFYRLRIIRYYQRQVKQKKLLEKSKVTA